MPETSTEADLIARMRSGDRTAFDSLYTMFSDRVWRYVARLVGGDAEMVAEVVQETFLSVVRSSEQIDLERGCIAGWIIRIAHNSAMESWRRRKRTRLSDERILAERNGRLARWFDETDPPESLLAGQETAALVRECLASLPDEYSRCLVAKYIDDLPVAQIAATESDSVEAVRSRLHRARTAFRETFSRLTREEARSM